VTLIFRREPDGKMRVTSTLWEDAKVFGRDQVLEVRNVDGRLQIARKEREPDERDPPVEAYDPYGPDNGIVEDDETGGEIDVV